MNEHLADYREGRLPISCPRSNVSSRSNEVFVLLCSVMVRPTSERGPTCTLFNPTRMLRNQRVLKRVTRMVTDPEHLSQMETMRIFSPPKRLKNDPAEGYNSLPYGQAIQGPLTKNCSLRSSSYTLGGKKLTESSAALNRATQKSYGISIIGGFQDMAVQC